MEAVDLAYGFVQAFNLLAARDRGRQILNSADIQPLGLHAAAGHLHREAVVGQLAEGGALFAVQFYQKLPRL